MKPFPIGILILTLCFACNTPSEKPKVPVQQVQAVALEIKDKKAAFKQIKWLHGAWEGTADGKPFCESWLFVNDTLVENRALSCETGLEKEEGVGAKIQVLSAKMYYTNNPKQGEPLLKWEITALDSAHIKLVNPTAPYSQTMIFEHLPNDLWKATLIGQRDTMVYTLHRRK
jgi:hypothetical protein